MLFKIIDLDFTSFSKKFTSDGPTVCLRTYAFPLSYFKVAFYRCK